MHLPTGCDVSPPAYEGTSFPDSNTQWFLDGEFRNWQYCFTERRDYYNNLCGRQDAKGAAVQI